MPRLAEKYDESHGCVSLRPRNQQRKRATTCAEVRSVNFGTMTSPLAHFGRSSHDVSRRKVGRISEAKSCEGTRSTAESSYRSWTIPQVCTEARDGSPWLDSHGVASVSETATAGCEMDEGVEGVEGSQHSSAARASVWAVWWWSTSASAAVEWTRCSAPGSARACRQVAASSRCFGRDLLW